MIEKEDGKGYSMTKTKETTSKATKMDHTLEELIEDKGNKYLFVDKANQKIQDAKGERGY